MSYSDAQERVLLVCRFFAPSLNTAARRPTSFAHFLPQHGFNPVVVTSALDSTPGDPDLMNSVPQDVEVFRCPVAGFYRILGQVFRFFKLTEISAWLFRPHGYMDVAWVKRATPVALRLAHKFQCKAVIASAPSFGSFFIAQTVAERLHLPLVLDYRDPWTTGYHYPWPTRMHYYLESRREEKLLRRASLVVCVTPGMRRRLVERWPFVERKVRVVFNGFGETTRHEALPSINYRRNNGPLQLVWTGRLSEYDSQLYSLPKGYGRGLGTLLSPLVFKLASVDIRTHSPYFLFQATRQLLSEHPALKNWIRLVFAGELGTSNSSLIKELSLDDVVTVLGWLPKEEVFALQRSADVLLLFLRSYDKWNYNLTGKIFEYLVSGRPILALIQENCDAAELIKKYNAGWVVPPTDTTAIKKMLFWLVEQKRKGLLPSRDTRGIAEEFSYRSQVAKFAEYLREVL